MLRTIHDIIFQTKDIQNDFFFFKYQKYEKLSLRMGSTNYSIIAYEFECNSNL